MAVPGALRVAVGLARGSPDVSNGEAFRERIGRVAHDRCVLRDPGASSDSRYHGTYLGRGEG